MKNTTMDKKKNKKEDRPLGTWYTAAIPRNAHKYECSECGHIQSIMTRWCLNCNSKMKVRG